MSDEHFGGAYSKLDPGLLGFGQVFDGVLVEMWPIFSRAASYILRKMPQTLASLERLLLEPFEVGTYRFGCEVSFVVLQKFLPDDVPIGEIQAKVP